MDDFIDLVQPNSTVSMGILLENRIYSSVRISLVYKKTGCTVCCVGPVAGFPPLRNP